MESSIDEQELAITYLHEMLPTYVEGTDTKNILCQNTMLSKPP